MNIHHLNAGADLYIVKPVKYPYLQVRVHGMHGVEKLDTVTVTVTTGPKYH